MKMIRRRTNRRTRVAEEWLTADSYQFVIAPPRQLTRSVARYMIMKSFIAFAIFFMLLVAPATAKRATHLSPSNKFKSGIAGRTTDPNGAVVVGTRITLTARSTKVTVSRKSNDVGEYVADLKPDVYDVEADADGFKKATRKGIPVLREARSFVDFVLEPTRPFDSGHP